MIIQIQMSRISAQARAARPEKPPFRAPPMEIQIRGFRVESIGFGVQRFFLKCADNVRLYRRTLGETDHLAQDRVLVIEV